MRTQLALALVAIAAVTVLLAPAGGCDLGCALEGEADACDVLCMSCTGCSLFVLSPLDSGTTSTLTALPSAADDFLMPLSLLPSDILHVPRLS